VPEGQLEAPAHKAYGPAEQSHLWLHWVCWQQRLLQPALHLSIAVVLGPGGRGSGGASTVARVVDEVCDGDAVGCVGALADLVGVGQPAGRC
jgi:hypothetical protein